MTEAVPNTWVDWQVKLESFRDRETISRSWISLVFLFLVTQIPARRIISTFYFTCPRRGNHIRNVRKHPKAGVSIRELFVVPHQITHHVCTPSWTVPAMMLATTYFRDRRDQHELVGPMDEAWSVPDTKTSAVAAPENRINPRQQIW
jgi:hypothetical protein